MYNKVTYDHEESRDNSIVREADIHWIPLSSILATQYKMEIQKKKV